MINDYKEKAEGGEENVSDVVLANRLIRKRRSRDGNYFSCGGTG